MEVSRVCWRLRQRIIDLVVNPHRLRVEVLHRDPRLPSEGHRPVAVERAARIDDDRDRGDMGILAPAHSEEVADGRFHRRLFLVVPIHPDDREAPVAGRGHPDVLDRARTVDLAERDSLPRLNDDKWVDLPTLPQIAGLARGYPLSRHPTLALLTGEILRADGSRLRVRDAI